MTITADRVAEVVAVAEEQVVELHAHVQVAQPAVGDGALGQVVGDGFVPELFGRLHLDGHPAVAHGGSMPPDGHGASGPMTADVWRADRGGRDGVVSAPAVDTAGPWLDLLVDGLATYRLTRLATADVISEPVRMALLRKVGAEPHASEEDPTAQEVVESLADPPRLATLITCRWCAGMWIAAGVTAARVVAPQAWKPVARGLALSAGAALLARFEDG